MDERLLLDLRIQLEELITIREGMIAANMSRRAQEDIPAYNEKEFMDLASSIAALVDRAYRY